MKKIITNSFLILFLLPLLSTAQVHIFTSELLPSRANKYIPADTLPNESTFIDNVKNEAEFKPSVQMGALMHAYFEMAQPRAGAGAPDEGRWQRNFSLYRARILLGVALSKNSNFFLETELPSIIGSGSGGNPKNFEVSQLLLDCQYEHNFSNAFSIIFGKMLVSNNRNGLQGAASLMANDFTHYQYAYNMFESSPLMGNFGRDIGVNTRGFLAKDKIEYRLGVFTGRRFDAYSPFRVVGRLVYNFLDPEKDLYYAGTKLGVGKTLALAVGVDAQTTYTNLNVDAFLDIPVGQDGAITANGAFAYVDGGDNGLNHKYSFGGMIPKQTIQFLELGYYFKSARIQPWIKYENQSIMETNTFNYGAEALNVVEGDRNQMLSNVRLGAGVNYFFHDYNTNLRLSYTEAFYGRQALNSTAAETKGMGQLWLQLQVFFF